MSFRICTRCDHANGITQMKEVVKQKYNHVSNLAEIKKYTCPYCGFSITRVEAHDLELTRAQLLTQTAGFGISSCDVIGVPSV